MWTHTTREDTDTKCTLHMRNLDAQATGRQPAAHRATDACALAHTQATPFAPPLRRAPVEGRCPPAQPAPGDSRRRAGRGCCPCRPDTRPPGRARPLPRAPVRATPGRPGRAAAAAGEAPGRGEAAGARTAPTPPPSWEPTPATLPGAAAAGGGAAAAVTSGTRCPGSSVADWPSPWPMG